MDDLISRQAVIKAIEESKIEVWLNHYDHDDGYNEGLETALEEIKDLPSAEPEKTVYIPETKAIPTARNCVDLAEKVTATFYDEEHEEWTQQTVTIADVLDSVCDDYTVLPSAQPETSILTVTVAPDPEDIERVARKIKDEPVMVLPSAEPETCEGCKHLGKWENEVEYGFNSPCTCCKRRVADNYER